MEFKDLTGFGEPLKRVIDCLNDGVSALMAPFLFKRMERAKLEFAEEGLTKTSLITLKQSLTQDLVEAAHTSRDKREIDNIVDIYGHAALQLQGLEKQLTEKTVSSEWSAHFFDASKDCANDDVKIIWSKILAGEIQNPGKYFKRTLTVLKDIEQHEAEWFVKLCQLTIDDAYVPMFVLTGNKYFRFNEFQSLIDCGLINGTDGMMEYPQSCTLKGKSCDIELEIKGTPPVIGVYSFTDSGHQICELVQCETNMSFMNELKAYFEKLPDVHATIISK